MKSSLTTVIILCCMCFLGCQSSCRSGPDSCSFGWDDACHWTFTSGWKIYWSFGYCIGLKDQHSTTERLESRQACSTNSDIHCLKFSYNFEETNKLSLSIIIKTSEFGEKEVWKMSSSSRWDDAQVPVNTSTEFTVIFEAKGSGNHRVYIDDIEYEEKECKLHPSAATPPITTTSPTTPQTPFTPDPPEHRVSSTSSGSAPTIPAPAQSSSNVGLIAGVVVAVVFLMVVGVVLFVLFKRKQTHDWKTCFTQQKGRPEDFHVHTTHNAVYMSGEQDPDQFINVDINPLNSDRNIQHAHNDTILAPSSAENHYSVTESPSEGSDSQPLMAEYVNVNSLKQPDHNEVPPDPHSADDNPYEIGDSGEVLPLHSAPAGEAYNTLDFHTPDSERCEGFLSSCDHSSDYNHVSGQQPQTASSTDTGEGPGLYQAIATCHTVRHHQPPAAQHHTVSSTDTQQLHSALQEQTPVELYPESSDNHGADKTAQYQQLDFDGKTPGEERSDDVSAQVYSHLNAGSEGAYDVIDRKPDKEQRDGEYSHI
ncbi:uncharacterized protein LOC143300249 [Babylonia areolata]|uniref:uncharacterized protein LOC143300249 n=1 Tax=Babylonia areolata TaxID=304850 RepID=UPI003FCF4B42